MLRMINMKITIENEAALDRAARELLAALGTHRHIALLGPMGAGKTTLVCALARVLGVTDDVTSPTFGIINEYAAADGSPIFHFDFYRIDRPDQAEELGLDDYFESGALCLMEWPENVADFLPDDTLSVRIQVQPDNSRIIEL